MNNIRGKRFYLGIVAIVCATVISCYLRVKDETILKLILGIVSAFMGAQTITDSIDKAKNKGGVQ